MTPERVDVEVDMRVRLRLSVLPDGVDPGRNPFAMTRSSVLHASDVRPMLENLCERTGDEFELTYADLFCRGKFVAVIDEVAR